MKTYNRLLTSLLTEFKRRAGPQVWSLWADLMELAEANDEQALSAAREQVLRRIRVLGRAASAANAHQVQSIGQSLERMVGAFTQVRAAARPELIDATYRTMNKLAETLYSIDTETSVTEDTGQSTESVLVESSVD
jgi:hypothetical protein